MENNLPSNKTILELLRDNVAENINEKIFHPNCMKSEEPALNEICFYKINLLTFDEEYPHREAFENVLQALDNDAFNFVYILDGNETGIELYIGVVKNQNENKSVLNAANYGRNIAGAFEGNFGGSVLEKLAGENLSEKIIESARHFKNAGVILGIPSVNDDDNDKYGFQGIDRLINSMIGLKWRIVVVCEPVTKAEILAVKNRVYEIYNSVSPYMHQSNNLQATENLSAIRQAVQTQNLSIIRRVIQNLNQIHAVTKVKGQIQVVQFKRVTVILSAKAPLKLRRKVKRPV